MTISPEAMDRLLDVLDVAGEIARCQHPHTPSAICIACGAVNLGGNQFRRPNLLVQLEHARQGRKGPLPPLVVHVPDPHAPPVDDGAVNRSILVRLRGLLSAWRRR